MPIVCLYFQVHQPFRLRHYSYFHIGHQAVYEDEEVNRRILDRVAGKCYLPANKMLLRLMRRHGDRFRCAFSLTGCLIDQLVLYRPDVLESFQTLAGMGEIEFLGETDAHSLAFLYAPEEFRKQVAIHSGRMERYFGRRPVTFRHTELIYNDSVAMAAAEMGFRVILADGVERLRGGRHPGLVYRPPDVGDLRILMRNDRLSQDLSSLFNRRERSGWALTVEQFASKVRAAAEGGGSVNLFMNYETFGGYYGEENGIFPFFETFGDTILADGKWRFATPAETAAEVENGGEYPCPQFTSWVDTERDLTSWTGNAMQRDALFTLYTLGAALPPSDDGELMRRWRRLQTSDHFYYMNTKRLGDGDVHGYFNPHGSPYDAYINYMNCLEDFSRRLRGEGGS